VWLPPPSGDAAIWQYASLQFVVSLATTRSHAHISEKPKPAAAPRTAPITGLAIVRRLRTASLTSEISPARRASRSAAGSSSHSAKQRMSPPAMKCGPAPVTITQRTAGSSATSAAMRENSRAITGSIAFSAAGALSTMRATAPCRSTNTFAVIASSLEIRSSERHYSVLTVCPPSTTSTEPVM